MNLSIFKDKTILITGGSGFLGRRLALHLMKSDAKEIRIFSRDESLQEKMKDKYPLCNYILGDVRDYQSVKKAASGVNVVIHAAAVKYLDWAQVQPTDCVKTNILGSMNVIDACMDNDVDICVGCSTDKAPFAVNVYGCSKQIMEGLFREANKYNKTRFVITRYGNVIGSTGSVIPKWLEAVKNKKEILLTDRNMKRFFMSADQAVETVFKAIEERSDQIPRLKTVNMMRLAELISEYKVNIIETGLRPGERLFEVLEDGYTTDDAEEFTDEEILELISEIEIG